MSKNICDCACKYRTFRVICSILVLFASINYISAFNVDLPSAVLYHGTGQSMFGFTVAEYKEDGRSWVLVGAPEAPDRYFTFEEPDYRGGSVYACDSRENDKCSVLRFPIPPRGNNLKADYRGRQWLGSTLTTAGNNGAIVACAPRYYWFTPNRNDNMYREPVGTCFYSEKGFSNFTEYSPCRINTRSSFGYGKLGSCQAGFSATISKDSNRFYLGAVGSYYWQGQLFSMHKVLKLPFAYDDHDIVWDEKTGKVISRNFRGRQEFMSTDEGPKHTDDSYMGYSVTSLEFFGSEIPGAAVGVPRADRLLGKVRIYTWNMINVRNLTGEQFASYFGYSICTSDVDGDGSLDLIVGAPMYSHFQLNDYESGRVYVYYQGHENCSFTDPTCAERKFARWDFIDGEFAKGRFGLAVASLGDINQDGYGDFAVSAPYEGSFIECYDQHHKATHTGAVYIFHGSRYGVRKKYSQVIRASEVSNNRFLNTFGFSLSGGLDLDDNLYPDLVVGAYESETVFMFRSRPVIQLVANFSFAMEKKAIGLDEYKCRLRDNTWVPCAMLQMCLVYEGIGVEQQIELRITITLDSRKPTSPRMFFLEKEEDRLVGNKMSEHVYQTHLRLYKGTPLCRNMTTYVASLKDKDDKLTPLEAELKYFLIERGNRLPGALPSILNMDDETPLTRKDALSIKNNCGEDNVCIPDLHMTINSNVDHYVLGSGHLYFNVSVNNDGEDSFDSTFKLRIPPGINYAEYAIAQSSDSDISISCRPPEYTNNYTIICMVGNPLPRGKTVNFSLILEPSDVVEESWFEFWANVNSTNSELSNTMIDNEKSFYIQIVENTSLSIESSCTPKDVYYNMSQYDSPNISSDIQAGPVLKHEYIIRNSGPSDVTEATAVFYWPLKIASGEDLLYLISEPETRGPIECDPIINPNYKRLEIKRKYREDSASSSSQGSWQSSGSSSSGSQGSSQSSGSTSSGSQGSWQSSGSTSSSGSQGSWQSSGSTSSSSSQGTWQITGSSSQETHIHGSKVTQTGSVNDIQRPSYTGNKGTEYEKPDGSFQVNVIGLHPLNNGGNSYQQSGQNSFTHQQSGQTGGYYQGGQGYQGGFSSQGSQGGGYSSTSQGGFSSNVQTNQGGYYSGTGQSGQSGYSGTSQSGQSGQAHFVGGQGGYYGTFQNGYRNISGFQTQGSAIRPNSNNFQESETTYTKTTDWDGNNPHTFSETKWSVNNNGNVRNGSFSGVHNGYAYDTNVPLNTDKNTFFSGKEGQSTFFSQGSSGSTSGGNVDINVINGNRVYDPVRGIYITTSEEKIISDPEVRRRLNETGIAYHFKGETNEYVQPNRITYGPATFTKDTLSSRMSTRSNKSPDEILRGGNEYSNDEDDEDDDTKDDDDDDEDEDSAKPLHRRKRQVFGGYAGNNLCSSAQCIQVQCRIRHLRANTEATVIFPSIVWVRTIQKIAPFRPVQVGSYVEVTITKLPRIRAQVSNVTYISEVLTNVTSLDYGKTPPDVIPLWVVVGSACLGALILLLLIFLLYKSGFFKRNRPPVMPERQPLNRNGQYHLGDEAL